MATIEEIHAAILRADKAGDSDGVRVLGAYLKKMGQPESAPDPTEGMSAFQRGAAGFGKAMVDTGRGIGQLLGVVSNDDVAESRRLDSALMNTTGGKVGNFAGNVAIALPTVVIPGAATLKGASLIGGAQGLLQPSESMGEKAQNVAMGGAAGAGGVAAGRALSGVWQGGRALLEPFSQKGREKIAGRMIERFADDPAKVLAAKGGKSVTGALPTIAEETSDAGMSRLQDAIRSVDPQIAGRIDARLADNNAARVSSLRGMTGQDGGREFAKEMRSGTAKDLYDRAFSVPIEMESLSASQRGEITKLMQMPAIQDALKVAQENAQNFGMKAGSDGSVMGLHQAKLALDDKIAELTGGGANQANKASAIKAARDRLVTFIEAMSPDYRDARMTYAQMSKPINAMDTASEVLRRGSSATSDLLGEPRIMPNALMRLLQDEPRLVQQATGRKGMGGLSAVMEPEQINLLRAVAGEVDKTGAVARAGNGPGSATAQRMAAQNILRQIVGPTGLPQSWAESALANTVVGKPLNLLYGGIAEPKIQNMLADAVLDPAVARRAVLMAKEQGIKLPKNAITELLAQAARTTPSTLAVTGQR